MSVTKLIEIKLGENGCVLRAIEGGQDLCLTHGQVQRAIQEGDQEEIRLYTYQEFGDGIDAWTAFLKLLNEELGPDPDAIRIDQRDGPLLLSHKSGDLRMEIRLTES